MEDDEDTGKSYENVEILVFSCYNVQQNIVIQSFDNSYACFNELSKLAASID